MKKEKKQKRSWSLQFFSGNSKENFIDLMAKQSGLQRAYWDMYHKAMMLNDFNVANEALSKLLHLFSQEIEILIRFGKIGPVS